MESLINDQIANEMYSANLYLSMSSYFISLDLDGFSNFYKVQAQEELSHAMKQFDYLHRVSGKLVMQSIPQPVTEFKSIDETIEVTLKHEEEVSKKIYEIAREALAEGDFATHTFIQWFITEQVEEIDTISHLLQKVRMIKDNTSALYLLNTELSQRKFAGTIDVNSNAN